MKNSRPSFLFIVWAALAIAAQAQTTPGVVGQGGPVGDGSQAAGIQDPQALVDRVERKLAQLDSLSAKVRMQFDLFDQQASGAGLYLQKRDGRRELSRFELKSQFRDATFAHLQVNDGRRFWTYREMPDGPSLNWIDLERISEHSQSRDKSELAASPGQMPIGGLPKLLVGLRQSFEFNQLAETQLADRRVWVVDGSCRPERLAAAVPDQRSTIEAGRPLDLKKLPAHLPEHAVLYIGQSDSLVYRIDYLRRSDRAGGAGQGSVLPGYRPIMTIEFFDVRVNQPIESREFQYQPPKGIKATDGTDAYIKSVGTAAGNKQ